MNKENFVGLVESIRESGKILRGEVVPARAFRVEVVENKESGKGFALCVKTDDPNLLIPSKVYPATFSSGGYVGIIDEEGESAIYPSDFFIRLDMPVEVKNVLENLQKAA